MEKHLFNLKFAAKELERHSKKSTKEENAEKVKCKKAIQAGNLDVGRIHAENAIRQHNQALNYLRMAARVDAVASRVQTAVSTKKITQSIGAVTKAMDSAMRSMNLEKVSQVMDKFEKQFEDLDVQTSTVESTVANSVGVANQTAQVDSLMQEIADQAGLEVNLAIPSPATSAVAPVRESATAEQDDLSKRLAQLRSM